MSHYVIVSGVLFLSFPLLLNEERLILGCPLFSILLIYRVEKHVLRTGDILIRISITSKMGLFSNLQLPNPSLALGGLTPSST